MSRVICIGSTSKDIFFPTDEGVILETPEDLRSQTKVAFELGGKFRTKDRYEAVGGVAANVAQGLVRLGIPAVCYSKIGHDEIGSWIQKELTHNEVDTRLLAIDPKVKSDLSAIIVIEQTGDRIIFHNRDANEKLEIEEEKLRGAEWFYVSALNGPWEENLKKILQIARKEQVKIALNPGQHNLKGNPRLMAQILRDVEVLLLNKDEAIELLMAVHPELSPKQLNDEKSLLKTLHQEGVPMIGLTDGKRGGWVSDGNQVYHAEIYEPHGLVDTTGAGDAFGSGFFSAYLHRFSLDRILQHAISNAGSVVGYYGASKGLLTPREIEVSLKKIPVISQ